MEDLNKLESACSLGKLNKGSCDPISGSFLLCCSGIFAFLGGLAGLAYAIYRLVLLTQKV
jgi:hypothetical protein